MACHAQGGTKLPCPALTCPALPCQPQTAWPAWLLRVPKRSKKFRELRTLRRDPTIQHIPKPLGLALPAQHCISQSTATVTQCMRHLQGFHPAGAGETRWVTGGAVQERSMQPPADTLLADPTGITNQSINQSINQSVNQSINQSKGTITTGLPQKQPAFGSALLFMLRMKDCSNSCLQLSCLITCNHTFSTRRLA